MNIKRIKFGLPFLDDAVGGVYFGLPALIKGTRDSGKTVLAVHFIDRILRIGEKALFFCETAPEAAVLEARSAGIDLEPAIRSGQLLLIPLRAAFASARDGSFPFDDALSELRALASRSSVGFAAFSSVVPWLAVTPTSDMPHRVDDFLATLSALSLTSILLVHKPASAPAAKLVDKLASACPVVLEMAAFNSTQRELRVVKCDGRDDLSLPLVFPLDLVPGKGLVPPAPASVAAPEPETEDAAPRPAVPPARRRNTLFGGHGAPAPAPARSRPQTLPGGAEPADLRAAVARHAASAAARHRATLFSAVPEPTAAPAASAQSAAPAAFSPPPPPPPPAPPPQPAPAAPAPQSPRPAPEEPPPAGRGPRIRFSTIIR